jgi:hypothetical protein
LRAGSTLDLLAQALRGALGIHGGEPLAERQAKLRARVAEHVSAGDHRRVTEFLGELIGAPFPGDDDGGAQLKAARQDAQLMSEQMRRAWLDFLDAETSVHPVLILLEDLHWGDFGTVRFIDTALRERSEQPWMVLALARPEVFEIFPRLWSERQNVQELRLKELGRKAGERLVRQVLGDTVGSDVVERLVKQADGNAFYLEELIRAVAGGHGDQLPDTVLAMAQARVEQLDPIARRLLRAASAFGERFWVSGVTAVVGTQIDVPAWLVVLEEQEVVARSREERFKGEAEYTFRHALMHDVAYATLTSADRVAVHRGAASWLERAGETDPLVMADQLEKGGEPEKAVPWLISAANAAYDGRDPVAARARAQRGAAHAHGEELGQLKVLEGAAAGILGDYATGVAASKVAVALLPKGTSTWLMAISNMQYFGLMSAAQTEVSELLEAFADLPPAANAGGLYAMSLVRIVYSFSTGGRPAEAKLFLQRIEDTLAVTDDPDPSFLGWRSIAKIYRHAFGPDGDASVVVASGRAAVAQFDELRDGTASPYAYFWLTVGLFMIGRVAEAAATNETALRLARAAGNAIIATQSELFVHYARALISDSDDDIQALEHFILNFLSRVPGVGNIKSSFALKQVKYQTKLKKMIENEEDEKKFLRK